MSQKGFNRFLSLLLTVSMILSLTLVNNVEAADDDLPENIVANKASFDTIDQVAATYESKFAGMKIEPTQYQVSINGEKRIKRINFLQFDDPVDVSAGVVYDLPEDIAKVFRLFGNMRMSGSEGLITDSNLEMTIIDPDGTEYPMVNHHIYWSGEYTQDGSALYTTYSPINDLKDSNIVSPWNDRDGDGNINYEGYKLKLKGDGSLNFVYIWEEKGMPTEYDVSAYSVLGKDKPIIDVTVDIDTTKNLSLDGENKMDESVFKRYHVNSGPVQLFHNISDWILDDEVFFKTTQDWGFHAGRGAFHFSAVYNGGGLAEDPDNPGWSDYTQLYANYAQNDEVINKLNTLYPGVGNDSVITFDGWPSWTWEDPNSTTMEPHFATPGYDKFDSAADVAANVYKAIDTRMGGYAPKYLEVKNESTIVNEWNFFNTDTPEVAWDKMAEFHNLVADEVKALNPDVLVGGPSSAFMYLERNDFTEAQYQLDFMDATKDSLDWYSHHFYENSTLYVNGKTDNSDGFLAGRFEAVMDLLLAHMNNTDNVKPILITEEGTYNGLSTDIDYFQILTAFNGYMLRFMEYANAVDMLVPYLYPVISWNPDAPIMFYKYTDSSMTAIKQEMTPLEAYVDLWKDFRGAYVPAEVTTQDPLAEERVFTRATKYGDKVYLAVHNLNDQRINLDINTILGKDIKIESINKKHYFLEKAELTYEQMPVTDMDNIYMRVQEMAVFEITLSDDMAFDTELAREVAYAKEELVDTGADVPFTIDVDTKDLEKSVLRLGFGKTGSGFEGDMTISVNGKVIGNRSLEYTNKSGDILTFIEFDVPKNRLKKGTNTVTVSMEEGGKITSMQLNNYYTRPVKSGVDTSAVQAKMSQALDLITEDIYVSDNGLQHPEGSKWITQIYYDAFVLAIEDAAVVLKDTMATTLEVNETLDMLDMAMDRFAFNLQDPVAELLKMPTISFEAEEGVTVTTDPDVTSDSALVLVKPQGTTTAALIVDVNPTDGSQSLAFKMDALNNAPANYWLNKSFTIESPDVNGWDLSKGFSVDIHNDNNFDGQIYLAATDASGVTGTIWRPLPADQASTITFDDYSERPDWTLESFGFSNGLDGKKITGITIYFQESKALDAGQSSYVMYIDNIQGNYSSAVAFETIDFEPGSSESYYVVDLDTSYEVMDHEGDKALKVTALTTDATWGKLSTFGINAPTGKVWDFSQNNLKMTVSNPMDYDVPIAVFYDSAEGGNNSAWINLVAGSSEEIEAVPWDPQANAAKISAVRVFVNESAIVGKENVAIIIDDVYSDWSAPVEEEVTLVKVDKPSISLSTSTALPFKAEPKKTNNTSSTGSTTGTTDKPVTIKADKAGKTDIKISKIKTAETLTIDGEVSFLFDQKSVQVLKEIGDDLALEVTSVEVKTLPEEVKKTIGDRPVYDFNLTSGTEKVSDFAGGSVTVSVPYEAAKGEDTNAIVVYYIDEDGQLITISNCVYKEDGTVSFVVDHFSTYGIGYNKVTFSDTDMTNEAFITYLSSRSIVLGIGNGLYGSGDYIRKGDFVTVLGRIAGIAGEVTDPTGFDDVAADVYYAPAVEWAVTNNIASGTGTQFSPGAHLEGSDVAEMLEGFGLALEVDLAEDSITQAKAEEGFLTRAKAAEFFTALIKSIVE